MSWPEAPRIGRRRGRVPVLACLQTACDSDAIGVLYRLKVSEQCRGAYQVVVGMTWVGDQACCCPGITFITIHGGTPHVSTGMSVSGLRTRHARGRYVVFFWFGVSRAEVNYVWPLT
jgi:hypothetical protein